MHARTNLASSLLAHPSSLRRAVFSYWLRCPRLNPVNTALAYRRPDLGAISLKQRYLPEWKLRWKMTLWSVRFSIIQGGISVWKPSAYKGRRQLSITQAETGKSIMYNGKQLIGLSKELEEFVYTIIQSSYLKARSNLLQIISSVS